MPIRDKQNSFQHFRMHLSWWFIVGYLYWMPCQNLYWKLGQQSAICWNSLGLFRDYGLSHVFFRNKTFLFFKIESWNFHVQFKIKIRATSQNFNSFSLFRQLLFSCFLSVVWLSWNFARFREIQFQIETESFSLLSWKTKKFYS